METLEIQYGSEEQGSKGAKSAAEALSNQSEMIEEILSRVPIKTLVRFMCVSKLWCNLISDRSFIKLHNTRTNNHGLIISAYNRSNNERYLLFVGHDDGSITQILTVPVSKTCPEFKSTQAIQHVNGLLLFCPGYGFDENFLAYVYNPSTRKIFKVPPRGCVMPKVNKIHYCYLLVFDESSSEHKILNFKTIGAESFGRFKPIELEIEIFSLLTYTWRKIDVDFPLDPSVVAKWSPLDKTRVCINSVIYFVLHQTKSILALDLITETFSSMNLPPLDFSPDLLRLTAINGSLGAFGYHIVAYQKKLQFWILDCKNQVWVQETINLSDFWINKKHTPHPVDFRGGEIVFEPDQPSTNMLSIPIYDMKKGTFRSVEVNLSHDLLCSETLRVNVLGVRSYLESMMPLKNSAELLPLMSGRSNTNA